MQDITPVSYTHLDVYKRQASQDVFSDDIDSLTNALERLRATAADQTERALDGALARWAGIASGFASAQQAYRQRQAERKDGGAL